MSLANIKHPNVSAYETIKATLYPELVRFFNGNKRLAGKVAEQIAISQTQYERSIRQ